MLPAIASRSPACRSCPSHWYVVREEGVCRLVPAGRADANLGTVALNRLQAGNLKAAQRWLDWAWLLHKKDIGWFDSLAGSPFAHLWLLGGRKAGKHPPRRRALVAEGRRPDAAVAILVAARKACTAKEEMLQIDRALARA